MSEKFPLYPELSEEGARQAQVLIDRFKVKMKDAAEEILGNLYSDIVPHIGSDSWTNYRNDLMDGLRNYNNRLVQGEYDFKRIREQIFSEFRAEIIKDLDHDNLKKIEDLQKEIGRLRDMLDEARNRG